MYPFHNLSNEQLVKGLSHNYYFITFFSFLINIFNLFINRAFYAVFYAFYARRKIF